MKWVNLLCPDDETQPTAEELSDPPYSRLSINLGDRLPYETIRRRFEGFDGIQYLQTPPRKVPLTTKIFVKCARSSQACRIAEAVDGQKLWDNARPAKVFMVLTGFDYKSQKAEVQDFTQIHVNVPVTYSEDDLWNIFKVYGDIVSITVQREETDDNQVLALIEFAKAFQAALAIEECDKSYNAVWAKVETPPLNSSKPKSFVDCPEQGTESLENQENDGTPLEQRSPVSESENKPPEFSEEKPMINIKEEPHSQEVQDDKFDGTNLLLTDAVIKCELDISLPELPIGSNRIASEQGSPFTKPENKPPESSDDKKIPTVKEESDSQDIQISRSDAEQSNPFTKPEDKVPESSGGENIIKIKEESSCQDTQGCKFDGFKTTSTKHATKTPDPCEAEGSGNTVDQESFISKLNQKSFAAILNKGLFGNKMSCENFSFKVKDDAFSFKLRQETFGSKSSQESLESKPLLFGQNQGSLANSSMSGFSLSQSPVGKSKPPAFSSNQSLSVSSKPPVFSLGEGPLGSSKAPESSQSQDPVENSKSLAFSPSQGPLASNKPPVFNSGEGPLGSSKLPGNGQSQEPLASSKPPEFGLSQSPLGKSPLAFSCSQSPLATTSKPPVFNSGEGSPGSSQSQELLANSRLPVFSLNQPPLGKRKLPTFSFSQESLVRSKPPVINPSEGSPNKPPELNPSEGPIGGSKPLAFNPSQGPPASSRSLAFNPSQESLGSSNPPACSQGPLVSSLSQGHMESSNPSAISSQPSLGNSKLPEGCTNQEPLASSNLPVKSSQEHLVSNSPARTSLSQETSSYNVQGSSFLVSDCRATCTEPVAKLLESSEHASNTQWETNSNEGCRARIFTSAVAVLERDDMRRQEFISKRLLVESKFPFVQEQLFNLFDLIPGLESCEIQLGVHRNHVTATIQYSNIASAIYARYKLHDFEYPFGNRLIVSFTDDGNDKAALIKEMATQLVMAQLSSMTWSKASGHHCLEFSGENIPQKEYKRRNDSDARRISIIGTTAGKTSSGDLRDMSNSPSVHAQDDTEPPPRKRIATADSSAWERVFIVFNPRPLPEDILHDIFSRFGNFINTYLIPHKNVGYAMFSDGTSARDAVTALHGRTVNGVKLKVILADVAKKDFSNRQRTL